MNWDWVSKCGGEKLWPFVKLQGKIYVSWIVEKKSESHKIFRIFIFICLLLKDCIKYQEICVVIFESGYQREKKLYETIFLYQKWMKMKIPSSTIFRQWKFQLRNSFHLSFIPHPRTSTAKHQFSNKTQVSEEKMEIKILLLPRHLHNNFLRRSVSSCSWCCICV